MKYICNLRIIRVSQKHTKAAKSHKKFILKTILLLRKEEVLILAGVDGAFNTWGYFTFKYHSDYYLSFLFGVPKLNSVQFGVYLSIEQNCEKTGS